MTPAPCQALRRLPQLRLIAVFFRSVWLLALTAVSGWVSPVTHAQEVRLLSLQQNGLLSWTNTESGGTYRVEWASKAEGPWLASWETLASMPGTNQALSAAVPMFYRVVWTAPFMTNLSAQAALTLITNRASDGNFAVLDVRTPSEFKVRHVKGALNLDFYSTGFGADLARLERSRAYLVYCGSGNRSGQTMVRMRPLGFPEVYNLTGGFPGLAAISEAAPWLEP